MREPRIIGRVVIAAGMLTLSGCFGFFGTRPGQSGLATKTVSRKEPPTSLIAIDYTRCLVTEEKFRNTPIGARVTCYWSADREGRVVTGGGTANRGAPETKVSGPVTEMTAKGAASSKPKKPGG